MQAFVPKSRKPKFELVLKILDLNNVPLVRGTAYVKWHLSSSAAAEHRGKTEKVVIKDHKVTWDYERTIQLRVTADKNGLLQDTDIDFEIMQEYAAGARGERISLGTLKLNLAEYVDGSYEADGGVTRRYLMQDSKINSTIKISIMMKQIEGEKNFTAPSLKSSPVFGGIAGIITSEQVEPDDVGRAASVSSKATRDVGEIQDLYRRTLTASWTSHMGDLPADECIEDIFSGGDGWGKHKNPDDHVFLGPGDGEDDGDSDDGTLRPPSTGAASRKPMQSKRRGHARQKSHGRSDVRSPQIGSADGMTSSDQNQTQSSSSDDHRQRPHKRTNEYSELELQDDFRSWQIHPNPVLKEK